MCGWLCSDQRSLCLPGLVFESLLIPRLYFKYRPLSAVFWPSLLVHSVLHCSDLGLLLIEIAEKIAGKRTYYYHREAHCG